MDMNKLRALAGLPLMESQRYSSPAELEHDLLEIQRLLKSAQKIMDSDKMSDALDSIIGNDNDEPSNDAAQSWEKFYNAVEEAVNAAEDFHHFNQG